MLIKGEFIIRNLEKAKKLLNTKFNKEKANYLILYGKVMKKEKQYEKAKEYFEKAILLNDSEALFEYGKILSIINPQIDEEEVNKYYKKAIKNGFTKAMLKYGLSLLEKDEKKGIEFIKMAADKGYPKALFQYAMYLRKSDDSSQNKEEYVKYLKAAAESGHIDSMYEYGLFLSCFENSSSKEESIYYLKKASDKGHLLSMYEYGLMVYKENREQNMKTDAIECLRIAAKNEHKGAMTFYGFILYLGDGKI